MILTNRDASAIRVSMMLRILKESKWETLLLNALSSDGGSSADVIAAYD